MGNPVVKNYIDPITGELVIGGEIKINGTMTVDENATVTGLPAAPLAAAGADLGGVKAAAAGAGYTVECKINGTTKKLMVPTYPVAANQADSTATEVAGLVVDFNALLAKLKAAGLMTDDT